VGTGVGVAVAVGVVVRVTVGVEVAAGVALGADVAVAVAVVVVTVGAGVALGEGGGAGVADGFLGVAVAGRDVCSGARVGRPGLQPSRPIKAAHVHNVSKSLSSFTGKPITSLAQR